MKLLLMFTLSLTVVSYAHAVEPNSAYTSKANLQASAILKMQNISLVITDYW